MPCSVPLATVKLILDGRSWHIHAGDAEAVRAVAALGDAMSLPSACGPTKPVTQEERHEVWVFVDPGLSRPAIHCFAAGLVACLLPSLKNNDLLAIGMSCIGQAIARAALTRGGLLIHGGLAAAPGNPERGVILAGPGTVGKTTASIRFPLPWRSVSDDTSFVIRDGTGRYLAHPWPTWSRFYNAKDDKPGPGGKWDVRRGLPLQAIFFLVQAKEDRVTPLSITAAVAFLMETVQHVTSFLAQDLMAEQAHSLYHNQLAAAEELVRTVPAYTLHLSLAGPFWDRIEEALNFASSEPPPQIIQEPFPGTVQETQTGVSLPSLFEHDTLAVTYSGPSMNPTLRHPDLLEVIPYSGSPIRPGDVVFYQPPTGGPKVIHRVFRVTSRGISTRGDNNCPEDPYLVQPSDIIGQVKAAWSDSKRRKIAGGIGGIWSGYNARVRGRLHKIARYLLHGCYHYLAASSIAHSMVPAPLQPRVFEFKQRYLPSILKLMINGRVIGRYDAWNRSWEIDRPWRLIINVAKLPVVAPSPAMNLPDLNTTALDSQEQQSPP